MESRDFKDFNNFPTYNTFKDNNENKITLEHLLSKYLADDTRTGNIVDQIKKKLYNIPSSSLNSFFNLYNKCFLDKVHLGLSEKQPLDVPSGLYIDIDIKQKDDMIIFDKYLIFDIVTSIIQTVLSLIKNIEEKQTVFVLVTKKPKIIYNEEKKYFKDGIHIIIPTLLCSKSFKKYLIEKLNKEILLDLLKDIEGFDKTEIVDTNSSSVVALLVGSSKHNSIPYDIFNSYQFVTKSKKIIHKSEFKIPDDLNIPLEFSLNNYEFQKLKRFPIFPNDEKLNRRDTYVDLTQVNNEEEEVIFNDTTISELKQYIDILDFNIRTKYKHWLRIVMALAKYGVTYNIVSQAKQLAIYFSKKREKGIRKDFERCWNDTINKKYKYPFTIDIIKNYASQDNHKEFINISNNDIFRYGMEVLNNKNSLYRLEHYHIANIVYKLYWNVFVVDKQKKELFIYVLITVVNKDILEGFRFKWVRVYDFNLISDCISKEVPKIVDTYIEHMIKKQEDIKEDQILKEYKRAIIELKMTRNRLFNNSFKNCVINESKYMFSKQGFSKELDTEEDIIGVMNGIVKLSNNNIELIDSYHPFLVSRTCNANYVPFDLKCNYFLTLLKVLYEMFPSNQIDALFLFMYYVSQSINNRKTCQPKVLILTGKGSNGKTVLTNLTHKTLGDIDESGYATVNMISYLTTPSHPNSATNGFVCYIHARLVIWTESSKNTMFDGQIFKKYLASNEPFPVRANFSDQQTVHPKINLLVSNDIPGIPDVDYSFTRRLMVLESPIKFCLNPDPENKLEKKSDSDLVNDIQDKIEYRSAWLSILITMNRHLKYFYDDDISKIKSPSMTIYTRKYINKYDLIDKFIVENVVKTDSKYEYPLENLVEDYCNWYRKNILEEKINKLEISTKFLNSRLVASIFIVSRKQVLRGHRKLDDGEEKNDDEEYLEVREIKDTSTSYTFDEFIKKLNDINNDVLKKFNEINKSNR